ncbi:hypothetical protein [Neorhizobium alkalisoli]|uniref:hypothetical protein n=1 Tax=Neorhizobium alkalisoli TaxID=528178 RepID=UPI001319D1E5|nr:hypothetical protein [Neorhizobium alkalisoli]
MNMHIQITADRTLLPRSLIKRGGVPGTPANMGNGSYQRPRDLPPPVEVRRYKFRLGAYVQFHDFLGVVIDRSATSTRRQVYMIEIIGESHGRPVRCVQGHALSRAAPPVFNPAA